MKLTTKELCEVAGMGLPYVEQWYRLGAMRGMPKPEAKGDRRIYTTSDALAMATAWRYSEAGASYERVIGIVAMLRTMPLERLEADLAAGRTMPVPSAMLGLDFIPGMMVEMPANLPASVRKLMRSIDLPTIHAKVIARVERLKKTNEQSRQRGRHRGLANV